MWLSLAVGGCVEISTYRPVETRGTTRIGQIESPSSASEAQRIRVAILVREPLVHLLAPETFSLSGFPLDATPVALDKGNSEGAAQRYREATLKPSMLYSHNAYIEPLGEGQIQVNGKGYRGSMEIIGDTQGTLTVINDLPLEDYVMGVLAGEVPRNWPLEALKAQAIAARTFAVLKRQEARQKGDHYDLENNASFQVYHGSDLVNDNIKKAILETKGEIATYGSSPILAFFHSNCGGKTSRALEVWSKDKPYLQTVDCPYGNNGEHFRWRVEIPIADLVRKLHKAGLIMADVVRINTEDRDESGRIIRLSLMDADGRVKTIKGSAFRMALGPDLLKSTRFDAIVGSNKVVFSGKGWGHGVGLCQEGACGMALKGYNAFDILRHYYKGIMVESLGKK